MIRPDIHANLLAARDTARRENPTLGMLKLARCFPALANKLRHDTSWDAHEFSADSNSWSHGERIAAQFVLSVFDHAGAKSGIYGVYFDVQEALRVWDYWHRAVFLEWSSDPWWP